MKKTDNRKSYFAILCAIGAFLLVVRPMWGMSEGQAEDYAVDAENHEAGEVLIKLRSSDDVMRLRFDASLDAEKILEEYSLRRDVEFVELNYRFYASAFPNDPEFSKQSYLQRVRAKDGWSKELVLRETGGITRQSIIAILDTGVDIDHPDLKNNILVNTREISGNGRDDDNNGYADDVYGWDFVSGTSDPKPKFAAGYVRDAINHGTIVAGIAAASGHNNIGISGVSWGAKILPLRVLDHQGNGNVYDVYKAVNYAIDRGANVINMSFVGNEESQILAEAIKRAYDAGVIVVVAAGNTSSTMTGVNLENQMRFPVCSDHDSDENFVVGVASVDAQDQRSKFSNYGNSCVDIAAPGEGFYGTLLYDAGNAGFQNYYGGYFSGTSVSAPVVSGVFAILKALRPDIQNSDLMRIVQDNASPSRAGETEIGAGIIDVYASIAGEDRFLSNVTNKESEEALLVAGLGQGAFPQLKVFQGDRLFKSFYAYAPTFSGDVNVAAGDVDGDGVDEIVTGAGFGGGPHVRVFTIEGAVKNQFFAFDKNLRNGITVAVGDVNNDGIDEIIVGAGRSEKPLVRVFNRQGALLKEFMAYSEGFMGGVNVAAGDVDGDGVDEIVTGAGFGGGPHVRVFTIEGAVLGQFFAFNKDARGGVRVAVGDVNNDIYEEIVAAMEREASPLVRSFRPTDFSVISEFFAYEPNFTSGLHISIGDYNGDSRNEIIVGPGTGGGSEVKAFLLNGNLVDSFQAHGTFYEGGTRLSVMRYK